MVNSNSTEIYFSITTTKSFNYTPNGMFWFRY